MALLTGIILIELPSIDRVQHWSRYFFVDCALIYLISPPGLFSGSRFLFVLVLHLELRSRWPRVSLTRSFGVPWCPNLRMSVSHTAFVSISAFGGFDLPLVMSLIPSSSSKDAE